MVFLCGVCGGKVGTDGRLWHEEWCAALANAPPRPNVGPIGWTCPVCGGGCAPTQTRCPCVPIRAEIETKDGAS